MNPAFNPAVLFAIASGGALGSLLRYWVHNLVTNLTGTNFPWGTLLINVSGSFVIGALAEGFALKWDVSQAVRAFLVIGICGGFTTFSTFALDASVLMGRSAPLPAIAYMAGSVIFSIGALYLAMHLVRQAI